MTVLFIDGHNFMHRARSGFQLGDFNVVYNFFRSLKPLVEQFKPTRAYFTLEGHPKHRYEALPTYKANRVPDQTTEEGKDRYKTLEDFRRQADVIVDVLSKGFPVNVMRHADFEADDLIYNVIKNASTAVDFVVVSTDTDFIQLLQEFKNVRLYNPVAKAFVVAPAYDYVQWKALRGDHSDNIPGIAGIGDERAVEILTESGSAIDFLNDPAAVDHWRRNCDLIRFAKWDDEQTKQMTSTSPTKDWSAVEARFNEMQFKSMLKEPYWERFRATFDVLWG